ncbi:MAG TPA: ferritin-like domain-containing protein [Burkholderiaceae bacterium]|nr:ferritin-like domain-containing protein [Burkholderiaceae bacterium]
MSSIADVLPWQLERLDLSRVDTDLMRGRDELLLLVCASSFIESGSETYTRNLLDLFADDNEVSSWLRQHWEPEELQHGRALRAYVQHICPEFDWERAYAAFFDEYSRLSTAEHLEPTRGRELAGRCIVEMGTTTYYQALAAACSEPVLRDLIWRIRCDELRHYKHFYAYFLRYREQERLTRPQVLAALARRIVDIRQNDAGIGLRHAATLLRDRRAPASSAQSTRRVYELVRTNFPVELAVRMTLKPLRLPPRVQHHLARPLAAIARHAVLR